MTITLKGNVYIGPVNIFLIFILGFYIKIFVSRNTVCWQISDQLSHKAALHWIFFTIDRIRIFLNSVIITMTS